MSAPPKTARHSIQSFPVTHNVISDSLQRKEWWFINMPSAETSHIQLTYS